MSKAGKKPVSRSGEEPTEDGPTQNGGKRGGKRSGDDGRRSVSDDSAPAVGKGKYGKGVRGPGAVDDSRRCTANKVNTGERCKAPAIKGGTVCRVHGGAAKQVKKAAKERLMDMVEPALTELHRVLTKRDTDDAVKVRAALGILDRTGFRQGVDLNVQVTAFEDAVHDAVEVVFDDLNPALGDGGGEQPALESSAFLDAEAAVEEADAEWAEQSREDRAERGRIRQNGHDVVRGEVVDGYGPPPDPANTPPRTGSEQDPTPYPNRDTPPPPREPDAPPRYVDWEAREADRPRGHTTRWG
jgi:hypothetical protein